LYLENVRNINTTEYLWVLKVSGEMKTRQRMLATTKLAVYMCIG